MEKHHERKAWCGPAYMDTLLRKRKKTSGAVKCILDGGGIGRGRCERSDRTRFSKDLNRSEEFVVSVIVRNYMVLLQEDNTIRFVHTKITLEDQKWED